MLRGGPPGLIGLKKFEPKRDQDLKIYFVPRKDKKRKLLIDNIQIFPARILMAALLLHSFVE